MSNKTSTQAMADRLSGRASRISITPAENGYVVDTDMDSAKGEYQPPRKAVFESLDGVKAHLDSHLPAKGKKKVIDTGAKKTKKVKVIDVGPKNTK